MSVVHDAAEFAELALLEQHGGVRLRKLATKGIELFGALAVATHQVADGPAPIRPMAAEISTPNKTAAVWLFMLSSPR